MMRSLVSAPLTNRAFIVLSNCTNTSTPTVSQRQISELRIFWLVLDFCHALLYKCRTFKGDIAPVPQGNTFLMGTVTAHNCTRTSSTYLSYKRGLDREPSRKIERRHS